MNNTVPSRWNRGIKYFNRKLVDHITVNINDGIVTFDAIAESEFFNDVYTTSISIDTINNKILGCSCTCEDYLSRHNQSNIFICKHIAATSITGIRQLKKEASLKVVNNVLNKNNKQYGRCFFPPDLFLCKCFRSLPRRFYAPNQNACPP